MSRTEILVTLLVAFIGGSGIPVWLLTRLDRKNDRQHLDNKNVLDAIRDDVSCVKSDVSDVKGNLIKHLEHHLEMGDGSKGRTGRDAAGGKSVVQVGRAAKRDTRQGTRRTS